MKASALNHGFETRSLPTRSPLPFAALPSVSLLPAAPLTDDTDYRMIHEELSGEILGAVMAVLNELKPGLDEKLYERAMIIELKHRGYCTVLVMSSGVETSLDSNC